MAIEKPAANALEFLRAERRDTVGRHLKVRRALDETKLRERYYFIDTILDRALRKYFQSRINEARRYWGELEVEEALEQLGVHQGLVTSHTIREYEDGVAPPAVVKQGVKTDSRKKSGSKGKKVKK